MTTNQLEEYIEVEDNTPSRRQVYDTRKFEVINSDYFLYTSLEAERTLRTVATGDNPNSWPPLNSDKYASFSLDDGIEYIIQYFKKQQPLLSDEKSVIISTVSEYIPSFVSMLFDILTFVQKHEALENMPQRDLLENQSNEFWQLIDKKLNEHFSKNSHLMIKYLQWRFAAMTKEQIDLTSIPPIGPYTKMHLKARDKVEYQKRNGERKVLKEKKSKFKESPNRKTTKEHNQGPSGDVKTQEVLEEVKATIARLQSEGINEFALSPQNSFLRRIQHQFISDQGHKSESIGEGKDRAVKLILS